MEPSTLAIMKWVLIPAILLLTLTAEAQTQEEWEQNVNWDGVSHWSEFLIFSPRFSGPNAMPVPLTSTGKVTNSSFVSLGGHYQGLAGDRTGNLTFYAGHTFLKNRISIDVFMVPIEVYKLSDQRKIERNVYFENFDKKTAIGDLYINTNVQLFNEKQHAVDVAIRIGVKTASSGLDNPARFIDSPGYYFDGSLGRTFSEGSAQIRPFLMLGFFAWQTNDEALRQNDAFLYGLGTSVYVSDWTFVQTLRGYSGYHDIGDKPVVLRTSVRKKQGRFGFNINYQYGIRHYRYHGLELVLQFTLATLE